VNFSFQLPESSAQTPDVTGISFVAAIALTILSFKGFTTITNQGEEIEKPKKNIARAITLSIVISLAVYLLIAWAVSTNLSLAEIIKQKDYALAAAAEPALGSLDVWFTVIIAIIATISGIIASVFAVSRMLAMLTNMSLIPHSHFGMPGSIQKHTLVYTVVIAMVLTVLFDLSRIASMGAILYLVMDILIHWGLFHKLKDEVTSNRVIVGGAILIDSIVLIAFVAYKFQTDLLIVGVSLLVLIATYLMEKFFLKHKREQGELEGHHS